MTISLEQLCQSINTSNTVLLFGSGSSIPSGAPSVDAIRTHLASGFSIDTADLSLSELAQVIEQRSTRRALVNSVRELFSNLRPTGGLLSIPRFKWKSIYTTNYDTLLEQSFALANEPVAVYSSNFDFGIREIPGALRLLKLHGSIDSDVADGGKSRLIITENDYELAEEFRQYLFTTLESDLIGTDLIIVGHSLSDPDIRTLITRVTTIRRKSGSGGSIYLFAYSPNLERAELHEARGLIVCFGGIDDFAMGLATHAPAEQTTQSESENPLGTSNHLAPITVDVHHSLTLSPEIADMFNGWPASYADIAKGSTFQRTVVKSAESRLIEGGSFGVVFLGASGVGKTTAARQLLFSLARKDFLAWEHKKDHRFLHDEWLHVASRLEQEQRDAVILIDDCDSHLFEINSLFDNLEAHRNTRLRVILTSARNRWSPRVKSPALSKTYVLEKPNSQEISNLLRLIDVNPETELVDSASLDSLSGNAGGV